MRVVDFGNGWNLTPDKWRRLYVLEWLYDGSDGQPDCTVTTSHAELARAFPGIHPATGNELRAVFESSIASICSPIRFPTWAR